jgi:ABC-type transport system substrate-binding protein
MRTSLLPATLVLLLVGCDRAGSRDDDAATGGTLVIATAADAKTLFPPLIDDVTGKQVSDQMFEGLAAIGEKINTVGDQGFTPRLAQRWEWAPDSLSIAFHIDPRARWHDGAPVTASDVRFSHQLYIDPAIASPHAAVVSNIDSITIRDSLTAVAWFGRRTPE